VVLGGWDADNCGWGTAVHRPMPQWRYRIQKTLVPPLVRLNLLSLGFFYIPIRGRIASPEQAPVLVSNHQTFVDIWLWLWQLLPVGVRACTSVLGQGFGFEGALSPLHAVRTRCSAGRLHLPASDRLASPSLYPTRERRRWATYRPNSVMLA
jgi:hypothetical protein